MHNEKEGCGWEGRTKIRPPTPNKSSDDHTNLRVDYSTKDTTDKAKMTAMQVLMALLTRLKSVHTCNFAKCINTYIL